VTDSTTLADTHPGGRPTKLTLEFLAEAYAVIITLIVRFLTIFHKLLSGSPLMCGFASPKGEQAKTSLDRIKKSISQMRARWQVEDREFNAATVRAYRHDVLHAEIFRFSLAPTTSNESKTLNLLIVDEAHLADDVERSNELDPMLAST
jgi:hypothetical protein